MAERALVVDLAVLQVLVAVLMLLEVLAVFDLVAQDLHSVSVLYFAVDLESFVVV